MIFGTAKPRIYLINGAGEAALTLSLGVYPNKLLPSFIPDLIEQRAIDNSLAVFNRGWWISIEAYFPYVSDTDFRTLVDIIKYQYEFDSANGYVQYSAKIMPHTDYDDSFLGYITTPLEIINEFHQLTHGIKFKFEGSEKLDTTDFLDEEA